MKQRTFISVATLTLLLLNLALVEKTSASEVNVGGKKAQLVDSFASVEDFFGKPKISVVFFSKTLSDEQKEQLAQKETLFDSDYEQIVGTQPVFKLWLIFDEGVKHCNPDKLVSYTAIFERTETYPFDVSKDHPLNWSFSRYPGQALSRIGISKLLCSFEKGSNLIISVKEDWLVEREPDGMWNSLLLPGKNQLLFEWNIKHQTIISRVPAP